MINTANPSEWMSSHELIDKYKIRGYIQCAQKSKKETVLDFAMNFLLLLRNALREQYSNARMYNYSLHGMYFESDLSLLSGTRLNVWLSNLAGSSLPDIDFAEVRWCEEISGAVVLYNFGAGIRYHQPITYREFPRRFQVIQGGFIDPSAP